MQSSDLETIVRNRLREIKRELRTGAQLADRQLQPIAHRGLVELRQLLESPQPDDKKYQVLKQYFVEPPDGHEAFRVLQERMSRVGHSY